MLLHECILVYMIIQLSTATIVCIAGYIDSIEI